jgi:anti-sigma regulatory factor (Ser/Thr protein kinase)
MKPADVDALVRRRAALLARSAQTRAAAAELITVSKQLTNRTASLLDHMTRTFANVHPTMMSAQARRMPSGPVLWFDAATLSQVRQMVLTQAAAAGLPEHSATDVVMAVHELAANAVRYGGGTGRLRVSVTPGTLCYRIEDYGPASSHDRTSTGQVTSAKISSRTPSWPYQIGHGLWMVRKLASQINVASGLHGSQVTVKFSLPS